MELRTRIYTGEAGGGRSPDCPSGRAREQAAGAGLRLEEGAHALRRDHGGRVQPHRVAPFLGHEDLALGTDVGEPRTVAARTNARSQDLWAVPTDSPAPSAKGRGRLAAAVATRQLAGDFERLGRRGKAPASGSKLKVRELPKGDEDGWFRLELEGRKEVAP